MLAGDNDFSEIFVGAIFKVNCNYFNWRRLKRQRRVVVVVVVVVVSRPKQRAVGEPSNREISFGKRLKLEDTVKVTAVALSTPWRCIGGVEVKLHSFLDLSPRFCNSLCTPGLFRCVNEFLLMFSEILCGLKKMSMQEMSTEITKWCQFRENRRGESLALFRPVN